MKKKIKFPVLNFSVIVDGESIEVVAKPYVNATEETRFRVSYNGSPIHIFSLDEGSQKVELLDDSIQTIPINLEKAIGENLLHRMAA